MRLRWRVYRRILLVCTLCFVSRFAFAAPQVLVVLSGNGTSYREAVETMRSHLREQGSSIVLRTLMLEALAENSPDLAEADMLVAVGTRAMDTTLNINKPTLNILVPRQNYEFARSRTRRDASGFSAIYLDQPWARQFRLIKQLLPGRNSVGILLGSGSVERIKPLQQTAREQKLVLDIQQVANQDEIIPALKRLLAKSKVLLALPDPLIFNSNTAQSILLTSYRVQTPLIAYSNAYVKAGALAAVYSTPAQIGQQTAETLIHIFQTRNVQLPPPQHPKYFSVSVNYSVGQSLGVGLQEEATILEHIKAGAERE